MNGLLFLVACVVFLLLLNWAIRTPSRWQELVQKAAVDGDLDPLLEELERRPELLQPRFYDEAMKRLLLSNLDAAVHLTIIFVPKYPEAKQSQYWLRTLREMEPRSPLLGSEFLEQYHRANCCTAAG